MRILAPFAALAILLQEKPEPTLQQLIDRLKDESTRSSAYYELARRSGEHESKSEGQFRECHRNPELVVCPQGDGKPPIYVLLSDFLSRDRDRMGSGRTDDKLFKPSAPGSRRKMKLIDAFTAEGKRIAPFGGANVVDDGLFGDINRAGFVVKVDGGGYAFDPRKSVSVLQVSVVREKAEPIFAVVYSFGERDSWGYDFIDEEGDGIPEIQLGPRTLDEEVVPRVTFKWDPAKKTYVGPRGGEGDHFRVIDPTHVWKEFARLEKEKVFFPPEENRASLRKVIRVQAAKAPSTEKAYSYATLKGRTDEQLFAFMGRGGQEPSETRGTETVEPPGFWTLAPKAAAMALVEANRSAKHRSQVELALDDRDGATVSETGVLRFTYESSRCYVAHDRHFLLQCQPKASFLIVVSTEAAGVVAGEMGRKGHTQDVRLCSLEDQEARHLLQVIGWLERVRSKAEEQHVMSLTMSTADGRGAMKLNFTGPKAGAPIAVDGRIWADSIPNRWEREFTKETYLNFVLHLLVRLADRRLERRRSPEFNLLEREVKRPVPKEVLEEQEKACTGLIKLHLEDPSLMPTAMVKAACDTAGDLGLSSVAPLLEKLRSRGQDGDAPAEALRKIGAARDEPALEKMALESGAKTDWALLQIKTRFPKSYPRALEAQLKRSATEEDSARHLEELAGLDVVRARTCAAAVPPTVGGPLGRAAFAILQDGPEMDREGERVKRQLETALDPAEKWSARGKAMDVLVPPGKPLRFPMAEIDAALERILKEPGGKDVVDFATIYAAKALERRRGAAHFDLAFARLHRTEDSYAAQELLAVVTAMAQQANSEQRGRLAQYLRGHLKETNLMISEICQEIWASDLQELEPDLERLATPGTDSIESARAGTAGGPVQPVQGKFHRARQVAQLWGEEDAVTRAKLLVAMALHEAYLYVEENHPAMRRRFDQALVATAKELTSDQRKEVTKFASTFAPKSSASGSESLIPVVQEALK